MKFSKSLIASAVLLATSTIAFAATDSTTVQINVTENAFVTLIGTALNSTTALVAADMDGTAKGLGTLGFNSNVTGTCSVDFASTNNYSLNHTVSGAFIATYGVTYNGSTVSDNAANTVTQDCLTAGLTPLTMASITNTTLPIASGTYADTVTITVTTP